MVERKNTPIDYEILEVLHRLPEEKRQKAIRLLVQALQEIPEEEFFSFLEKF